MDGEEDPPPPKLDGPYPPQPEGIHTSPQKTGGGGPALASGSDCGTPPSAPPPPPPPTSSKRRTTHERDPTSPVKCRCGKTFPTRKYRDQHVQYMAVGKTFPCVFCGHWFHFPGYLRHHLMVQHGHTRYHSNQLLRTGRYASPSPRQGPLDDDDDDVEVIVLEDSDDEEGAEVVDDGQSTAEDHQLCKGYPHPPPPAAARERNDDDDDDDDDDKQDKDKGEKDSHRLCRGYPNNNPQ